MPNAKLHVANDRVHIVIDGSLVADLPWDAAQQFADALRAKANEAESNHWREVDKYFTDGVKVRRVMGVPVLTSKDDLERLG